MPFRPHHVPAPPVGLPDRVAAAATNLIAHLGPQLIKELRVAPRFHGAPVVQVQRDMVRALLLEIDSAYPGIIDWARQDNVRNATLAIEEGTPTPQHLTGDQLWAWVTGEGPDGLSVDEVIHYQHGFRPTEAAVWDAMADAARDGHVMHQHPADGRIRVGDWNPGGVQLTAEQQMRRAGFETEPFSTRDVAFEDPS